MILSFNNNINELKIRSTSQFKELQFKELIAHDNFLSMSNCLVGRVVNVFNGGSRSPGFNSGVRLEFGMKKIRTTPELGAVSTLMFRR
ncbi:jg25293 [Pararge aegeria aegeria]|uniref:Jg25293 protein n=1 Tax=Pararge aegeria aegeria TaxID=348720 RepID=A0A8S4S4G6_9NEOP|nr:jg25293 [Pararge aegeria aegeria]